MSEINVNITELRHIINHKIIASGAQYLLSEEIIGTFMSTLFTAISEALKEADWGKILEWSGASLSDIQKLVFEAHKKSGHLAMWCNGERILKTFGDPNARGMVDLAELGLIGTEVTEAMEDVRSSEEDLKEKLAVELSDIIIRTLNFASRKGIEIEPQILKKHKKNLKRGFLHGRAI